MFPPKRVVKPCMLRCNPLLLKYWAIEILEKKKVGAEGYAKRISRAMEQNRRGCEWNYGTVRIIIHPNSYASGFEIGSALQKNGVDGMVPIWQEALDS